MSVIYKRSEREREWDTTSARGSGAGYTTVRRYKVPDHSLEEDTYESEMRLVHRSRDDFDDRRSVKDYVIERHQEPAREVRHYHYTEREREVSPQRSEYRIQREYERSPSPARTEIRISRDYERDREIFPREQQPYELEKYSRSTEYFRPEPIPQPQPQPIYIRNEAPQPMQMQMQPIIIREEAPQPIIIRERIQEPAYELVERTTEEDRQVVRPRQEEDYYYERRVKEIDRGSRYDERYADEREYDHRWGDKNYYSDDDVYIHKEKDTWGGSETRTKRDVAAGALAGVAAGQIIRHHRKRKGEAPGGSIGNALGYGTLGAKIATEADRVMEADRALGEAEDDPGPSQQLGLTGGGIAVQIKVALKVESTVVIRYTPIARPEVEAGAAAGTEAVRTVADDDEALRHLMAGAAVEVRVEQAKRRDRKKAEKEAERRREDDSAYSTGTYSPYDSPTPSTAHPNDSRFFPETNYFPPPPSAPVDHNPNNPYPPYNPADYPPPPSAYEPNHPSHFVNPPHEDLHLGNPYAPQHHQQHEPYYGQPRRGGDNVSAPVPDYGGKEHYNFASARGPVDEPRSPSPTPTEEKSVKFDLSPQEEPSREPSREPSPDSEREHRHKDDHSHNRHRRRKDDDRSDISRESGRAPKRRHRSESPASDASDATIELPPRFDEHGRRQPEDPLAKQLENEKPHLHTRSRIPSTTPSYRSQIDFPCSAHLITHWHYVLVDMLALRCFSFFAAMLTVAVSAATAEPSFPPCTGGSIYFTAHTADSLLFQNPDLYHDVFVFKCITTVVLTADSGGEAANHTRVLELERGLENAYRFMSNVSVGDADETQSARCNTPMITHNGTKQQIAATNDTTVQIGEHTISASSLLGRSNVQILYLRLPQSGYFGKGYEAYSEESLARLYNADIPHITTTDGKANYSVQQLKDIIATIIRSRQANDIRMLNYFEALNTNGEGDQLDHTDRLVSAKLVMNAMEDVGFDGNVKVYASDSLRMLRNNLNVPDCIKKADTFFEYAKYDPDMCQSLDECSQRRQNLDVSKAKYAEVDHVAEFLQREYYVE
ncbi:hypothetical protein ACET3X_007678 [Alternaria dauci]|uniref:DUF3824 domain-containing protein n=1 Tax=Alternaria dauci TaxID=48095 RepID=A0ABR3UCM0_9PLEO